MKTNHNSQTNATQSTQDTSVDQIVTMTTMERVKLYFPYLVYAVALVTAFFIHESFVQENTTIDQLRTAWKIEKAERSQHLEAIKSLAAGTKEHEMYMVAKNRTDTAFEKLKEAKRQDEFLGFPNFQIFMGEFGWAFGLLLIGVYMLFKDLYNKGKALIGELIVDTTIICISLFFIKWTFNNQQDFSRFWYIFVNVMSALLVTLGAILIVKRKEIEKIKIKQLFAILWRGYYEDLEKKKLIDPNKPHEFKQFRVELTEEFVEHEQK